MLDSKERGFDYGLGVPVDFEFEVSGFEKRDENFVFLVFEVVDSHLLVVLSDIEHVFFSVFVEKVVGDNDCS